MATKRILICGAGMLVSDSDITSLTESTNIEIVYGETRYIRATPIHEVFDLYVERPQRRSRGGGDYDSRGRRRF